MRSEKHSRISAKRFKKFCAAPFVHPQGHLVSITARKPCLFKRFDINWVFLCRPFGIERLQWKKHAHQSRDENKTFQRGISFLKAGRLLAAVRGTSAAARFVVGGVRFAAHPTPDNDHRSDKQRAQGGYLPENVHRSARSACFGLGHRCFFRLADVAPDKNACADGKQGKWGDLENKSHGQSLQSGFSRSQPHHMGTINQRVRLPLETICYTPFFTNGRKASAKIGLDAVANSAGFSPNSHQAPTSSANCRAAWSPVSTRKENVTCQTITLRTTVRTVKTTHSTTIPDRVQAGSGPLWLSLPLSALSRLAHRAAVAMARKVQQQPLPLTQHQRPQKRLLQLSISNANLFTHVGGGRLAAAFFVSGPMQRTHP